MANVTQTPIKHLLRLCFSLYVKNKIIITFVINYTLHLESSELEMVSFELSMEFSTIYENSYHIYIEYLHRSFTFF